MPSSQRMAAEGPLLGVFHPCSSPGAGGPQLAGGGGGGSGAGGRRFTGWSGICLSFLGTKNARACKRWLSSFSPEFSDDSYLTILVRLLMLVLPHIKDLVEKMVR